MIQDFGLLPHWTIEQNVASGSAAAGWPAEKQRERTHELLEQVGLDAESSAREHQRSFPEGNASGWQWRGPWQLSRPAAVR